MRLLPTLLLALASLSAPLCAQTVTYRDFFVRGSVAILDLGNGPRLVVSGTGPAHDFAGYIGGDRPIVGLEFDALWVYDGHGCRVGHTYAIHNSSGFTEAGFRLANPMQWGPLGPARLPGDTFLPTRGGYTTYSLSVCAQWPSFGDRGASSCPNGNPDGCIVGLDGPQFWSVVMRISG